MARSGIVTWHDSEAGDDGTACVTVNSIRDSDVRIAPTAAVTVSGDSIVNGDLFLLELFYETRVV